MGRPYGTDATFYLAYMYGPIKCVFRWHNGRPCGEPASIDQVSRVPLCDGHLSEVIKRIETVHVDKYMRDYATRHRKQQAEHAKQFAKTREAERRAYAQRLAANSLIYYVQRHGDDAIKIGVTVDLDKRLATFRHVTPVTLLATHRGDRRREQLTHQYFADCRISGEWFQATPRLLAHIEKVKAAGHDKIPRLVMPKIAKAA